MRRSRGSPLTSRDCLTSSRDEVLQVQRLADEPVPLPAEHHVNRARVTNRSASPFRRHHKLKQTPGWRLEQPQPGVFRWTAPSGRTYTTTPTVYDP
jgi:hypothetical protein